MRIAILALCLMLTACGGMPHSTGSATWTPSDAATSLLVSGPVQMRMTSSTSGDGSILNSLELIASNNRHMNFIEAIKRPVDLSVQEAGGALAEIMSLSGGEKPVLYRFNRLPQDTKIFLCAPDGPALIGVLTTPAGDVTLVALKSEFQTATRPDGKLEAYPYSPDHICARAHFRRS